MYELDCTLKSIKIPHQFTKTLNSWGFAANLPKRKIVMNQCVGTPHAKLKMQCDKVMWQQHISTLLIEKFVALWLLFFFSQKDTTMHLVKIRICLLTFNRKYCTVTQINKERRGGV